MKFVVFLLAALLVQAFAQDEPVDPPAPVDPPTPEEPVNSPMVDKTKQLMGSATDYQDKANKLQEEINAQLALIRNTIFQVLEENMNKTIEQTDSSSALALQLYTKMEEKMEQLVKDDCYEDLVSISTSYLSLAGFQVSNILEDHDRNVTDALGDAEDVVSKFDYTATNIQRLVMRSFIKRNLFKESEKISQKFISDIDGYQADWAKISPSINQIVLQLRSNFEGLIDKLNVKYQNMNTILENSYNNFENIAFQICIKFSRTGRFARSVSAGKFRFFNPEDILPKF